MKRVIIILTAAVFLFSACDTNPGVSKAFAKYSHQDGVTSVTVPGWLIGIATSFGDLSEEENELLSSIDKVKILTIENEELNKKTNLHKEFHEEINKNQEYEELLTISEKKENVTIFAKMTEDVITEMVILVGGDDNVLIYFEGEIKPELINKNIDLTNPDKFLSMKF